MKKDRNSFFSQFGSYGYQTNPQMNTGNAKYGNQHTTTTIH